MTEKNQVYVFNGVDVSNHVQRKMGLCYLNWAFVVDTLRKHDPNSTYSVKPYKEINLKTGQLTGRDVNYFMGVNGNDAYVTVTVTFRGQSQTESLPCYNFKGQAVRVPDAMLVNKTIKRCYVKAAAILTGLGISLYIDGSTNGDGRNAQNNRYHTNYRSSNNHSNNYQNQSSDRRKSYQKTQSNNRKEPQEWVLKSIQKQLNTKYDNNPKSGKLFKSLYDNRNDLQPAINQVADMKHCSPAAAAYDIGKKYLAKLPNKPKHQASDVKPSVVKEAQGNL